MERDKETLGWYFPLQVNPQTGSIQTTDLKTDIRQSLLILLSTRKGERLGHKNYGCNLDRFMFEPITYSLIKEVKEEVKRAIKTWEKRVTNVEVKVLNAKEDETMLVINISYVIIDTEELDQFNHIYHLLEE